MVLSKGNQTGEDVNLSYKEEEDYGQGDKKLWSKNTHTYRGGGRAAAGRLMDVRGKGKELNTRPGRKKRFRLKGSNEKECPFKTERPLEKGKVERGLAVGGLERKGRQLKKTKGGGRWKKKTKKAE